MSIVIRTIKENGFLIIFLHQENLSLNKVLNGGRTMIVQSMNRKEIFIEVNKDFENVARKANYILPKLRRNLVKSKKTELSYVYDYFSPRKNNWIVCLRVSKKGGIAISGYAYTKGFLDFYMPCVAGHNRLIHFTRHFAKRYRERFLKDEEIDLVSAMKEYILRNDQAMAFSAFDDPEKFVSKVIDGITLGTIEWIDDYTSLLRENTFLSYDMLRNDQVDLAIDLHERLMKYKDENKSFGFEKD